MKAIPRSRYILFGIIAVVGTTVDLLTKHWIFDRLWPWPHSWPPPREVVTVWKGYFELEVSLNQGALFGIGQGWVWLFATLSIVALLGILFWLFWLGEARNRLLCVALAAVTGGILGNLYDRLGLHGMTWPLGHPQAGEPILAVRDWILWQYGEHRWPNFNIADVLLVCGAILIAFEGFRDHRRRSAEEAAEETAPKPDQTC